MIIQDIKKINSTFFDHKYANKYCTDRQTLRIGNIISSLCSVDIINQDVKICSDESMNFMIELPEISNYAGVCFQQLFLTNVANTLSNKKYTDADIEIINNDIVIKKEHNNAGIHQLDGVVSASLIKNCNGAILIYLGIYNRAGNSAVPRAFSLNLDSEVCYKFMDDINGMFYYLANSIFLKTAKM